MPGGAEGRGDDAQAFLKQGLAYANESRHRWYVAALSNEVGEFYLEQRRSMRNASKAFRKARAIATKIGSPDLQAWALFGLARAEEAAGPAAESAELYESLRLVHKSGEVREWMQARPPAVLRTAGRHEDRPAPMQAAGPCRRTETKSAARA